MELRDDVVMPHVLPSRVCTVVHLARFEEELQVGQRVPRFFGVVEANDRLVIHEAFDQLVVVQAHDVALRAERDGQHLSQTPIKCYRPSGGRQIPKLSIQ